MNLNHEEEKSYILLLSYISKKMFLFEGFKCVSCTFLHVSTLKNSFFAHLCAIFNLFLCDNFTESKLHLSCSYNSVQNASIEKS